MGFNVLNKKIHAATVVEALVAMLIIMATFASALVIFKNTQKKQNNSLKIQSKLYIEKIKGETFKNNAFLDQDFILGGITISRIIEPYKKENSLFVVTFDAHKPNGEKIITINELVIINK